MKDRVLKLWRKHKAKAYYSTWKKGTLAYEQPIRRDGYCNEWNYYDWSGAIIHHNIETDRIIIFCDAKRWEE